MKSLKQILSYLMAIIMCVFLFSGIDFKEASAEEVISDYEIYETDKGYFKYFLEENGISIIEYLGSDKELIIPKEINGQKVTTLLNGSFTNAENLESIELPSSISNIGIESSSQEVFNCSNAETYAKENSIPFKEITNSALSISSFTANKQSPQVAGTEVILTAKATGSGILQYKFIIKDNKTGNWAILRNYETSNTYVWKTKATGDKTLCVDVKDGNGQVTRKSMNYTIKEAEKPPVVSSFTANKQSPQLVGTEVTLTANATGSGNLKYKFLVKDSSGNWFVIQDYSTSNKAIWKAGKVGNKVLYVDVKDGNGQVTRKSMNYTIKEAVKPPVVSSFTTNKQSPQVAGTEITLTANATGTGKLQYKFLIKDSNGSWALLRNYEDSNTYVWKTGKTGDKVLYVDIKDSNGQVTRKSLNYTVADNPTINVKSNITIKQNAKVQVSDIVESATDWKGNDITSKVSITGLNTSIIGTQKVTISVTDSYGFSSAKLVNVTIIEEKLDKKLYKVNTDEFNDIVKKEMYRLVNEHRNNNGLSSYKINNVLEECAFEKSKHMSDNNYFDHYYNGETWYDMYPEKYKGTTVWGENIAYRYTSYESLFTEEECKTIAEMLFQQWKESPGHNANMLQSMFNSIGFGLYVNASGKVYATQQFGRY